MRTWKAVNLILLAHLKFFFFFSHIEWVLRRSVPTIIKKVRASGMDSTVYKACTWKLDAIIFSAATMLLKDVLSSHTTNS